MRDCLHVVMHNVFSSLMSRTNGLSSKNRRSTVFSWFNEYASFLDINTERQCLRFWMTARMCIDPLSILQQGFTSFELWHVPSTHPHHMRQSLLKHIWKRLITQAAASAKHRQHIYKLPDWLPENVWWALQREYDSPCLGSISGAFSWLQESKPQTHPSPGGAVGRPISMLCRPLPAPAASQSSVSGGCNCQGVFWICKFPQDWVIAQNKNHQSCFSKWMDCLFFSCWSVFANQVCGIVDGILLQSKNDHFHPACTATCA